MFSYNPFLRGERRLRPRSRHHRTSVSGQSIMFKISVIGAGYWGRKVIAEYCAIARTRKDLEVSFVADLSKNAVGSIATNFPDVQRTSTNVDSVLTHKDVDAVHICTPNETHFGLALQALKAGKH